MFSLQRPDLFQKIDSFLGSSLLKPGSNLDQDSPDVAFLCLQDHHGSTIRAHVGREKKFQFPGDFFNDLGGVLSKDSLSFHIHCLGMGGSKSMSTEPGAWSKKVMEPIEVDITLDRSAWGTWMCPKSDPWSPFRITAPSAKSLSLERIGSKKSI